MKDAAKPLKVRQSLLILWRGGVFFLGGGVWCQKGEEEEESFSLAAFSAKKRETPYTIFPSETRSNKKNHEKLSLKREILEAIQAAKGFLRPFRPPLLCLGNAKTVALFGGGHEPSRGKKKIKSLFSSSAY